MQLSYIFWGTAAKWSIYIPWDWASHGGYYSNYSLLHFNAMYSGKPLPLFWRNMLPPSSDLFCLEDGNTEALGMIYQNTWHHIQKTVIFITTVAVNTRSGYKITRLIFLLWPWHQRVGWHISLSSPLHQPYHFQGHTAVGCRYLCS
jgi:hypothetical protein